VAERLTAPPGRKARGILTVLIELLGAARIVKRVGTEAFYPPPKVESAIIEIDVRSRELETADVERIMKVVKFGFSKRRAQLKNVFKKYPSAQSGVSLLASAGINGTLRAEDLTADDWRKLAKFISDK